MSLYRILTLARRVVQQLLADPRTLALIFFVPLVVLTVAGVLVRLEPSEIKLAIVMEDEGGVLPIGGQNVNLGERLTTSLDGLNENINVKPMDADEAQDKLNDGDLDAIITIPQDFTAQSIQNQELNIRV